MGVENAHRIATVRVFIDRFNQKEDTFLPHIDTNDET